MATSGRRAAREREMWAVLERWQRSGLPLSRFAEGEGIAGKTLYRWRRRLGVGADQVRRGRPLASIGAQRAAGQSASMFTEVSAAWRATAAATIEVVLCSGTLVRVPEHFDAGALRILLETLREC
jgi:hypothetical protein